MIYSESFYQTEAGTLPLDAPTYVEREADDLLYQFAGSLTGNSRDCFVLAPRQTGKTSLMVRTANRLTEENLICVRLNIHQFAGIESDRQLWFSLLDEICQQVTLPGVNLPRQLEEVWNRQPDLAPALRFKNFLIKEILEKIAAEKLVIFIDEIQDLVDLNLQNVFIGFIRSLSDQNNEPLLNKVAFVLLGVAKPSDLMTRSSYALNLGDRIELGRLTPEACKPLRPGLEKVTTAPATTLERILYWTGGQPFLTQIVCHLVATGNNIEDSAQIETHVDTLVHEKIITDWRRQDRQSHLQEIEHWFTKVESSRKAEKLKALRLYRQILTQGSVSFRQDDPRHWDLLISGLVAKDDEQLEVANPIYAQIFNPYWITRTENLLQEGIMGLFSTIYNRDVFMLIDQSASMADKDADTRDQSRYDYLKEVVKGHILAILEETQVIENQTQKICDEVKVCFFGKTKNLGEPQSVKDTQRLKTLFGEHPPRTKTFIAPTLEKCLSTWKTTGQIQNKGAFFIIYTDGLFDDETEFKNCIQKNCHNLQSDKEVKFLILGLGEDIDKRNFLALDFNINNNLEYNVVVFDLVNEVEEDIIDFLERQLVDDPTGDSAIPDWVKQEFPDFVDELKKARTQTADSSSPNVPG
ncbi:AAA-like domain-containing protein [Laspinema sp. D1]|uniref:AAA-like domain-containing protein n=1 Tax=Laspinema palackyanum TaxID=3231601 RepID=UPI003494D434|nr:AAA-like domain-containing protein [Laspinema sp. D2b]